MSRLNRENSSRKVLISELSTENTQQRQVIIDLKSTIDRQNQAINIQKSIIEGQVKTIDEQRKTLGAYNCPPMEQPRGTETMSIDATNLPGESGGTRYLQQMTPPRKRRRSNASPEESVSDVQSNAAESRRRPRQKTISHANRASPSRSENAKMTDIEDECV